MEARLVRAAVLAAVLASLGAGYRTTNFVVDAPTPDLAEKIGRAAEQYRNELAMDWLGSALPNWPQPCPIHAQVAPNLGAGGATSFVFDHGDVFGWQMNIQGSEERILDSVLPHEVTHTVFASYFRRPLPRWADEGACTTVEHTSERSKQERMLIDFLRTNRGIAFSQMFMMTEYPQDILPLYAQGYALARFLIDLKGKPEFLAYLKDGMASENWTAATARHYGYKDLAVLQNTWLEWIKRGSPLRNAAPGAAELLASATAKGRGGSNLVVRAQSADRDQPQMVPVHNNDAPITFVNSQATPARSRRDRSNDPPVRNGSVVIDRGEPLVAATGNPPPMPTAVAASGDGASIATRGAVQLAADDGSWRTANRGFFDAGEPTPVSDGRSVYGNGVGLIHHSPEAVQTTAQLPTADPDEPAGSPTAEHARQVILEWARQ
ncbi:MAG TPA: hypothetical protein VGY55_04140 [Pirellulales bacterium]|jgi:hypothetical protein|nr:hypothetical protein [Pirellulales bacterium]